MSIRNPDRALILRPRASRRLATALLLVHGAAALSVLWSPMHWCLHSVAGGLILASIVVHWRALILRRAPRSIVAAQWSPSSGWQLSFPGGLTRAGDLSQNSIVLPWVVILSFRCQAMGRVHLILPTEALEAELARELRVRLRTGVCSTDQARRDPSNGAG